MASKYSVNFVSFPAGNCLDGQSCCCCQCIARTAVNHTEEKQKLRVILLHLPQTLCPRQQRTQEACSGVYSQFLFFIKRRRERRKGEKYHLYKCYTKYIPGTWSISYVWYALELETMCKLFLVLSAFSLNT